MLVKIRHPSYRNEPTGVGGNRYHVDANGFALVSKRDADVLISVAGWKRIEEVEDIPVPSGNGKSETSLIRFPRSREEFMIAVNLISLSGDDLRNMADEIDPPVAEEIELPSEGDTPEGDISDVEDELVLSANTMEIREQIERTEPKVKAPSFEGKKFHELKAIARELGVNYERTTTKMDLLMALTAYYNPVA